MSDHPSTPGAPQRPTPGAPQAPRSEAPLGHLDWQVWVGIVVALVAAMVASWAALYWFAHATGWRVLHLSRIGVSFDTAHLLPASVDVGGISAGWVWLRGSKISRAARAFAKRLTYGVTALSLLGNAGGHLVAEGVLSGEWWPLIVLVGAVPAVMVVSLVHLAALCTAPPEETSRGGRRGGRKTKAAEAPQPQSASSAPAPEAVPPHPTTPAAPQAKTPTVTPPRDGEAPQPISRAVIVMDILATATTPADVPGPKAIRTTWGCSKNTADRARADALAALASRQEA